MMRRLNEMTNWNTEAEPQSGEMLVAQEEENQEFTVRGRMMKRD